MPANNGQQGYKTTEYEKEAIWCFLIFKDNQTSDHLQTGRCILSNAYITF